MRTTVSLDDDLFREIKIVAAESGRTMNEVVQDALREALARRKRPGPIERVRLPVSKGGVLLPGIDLDDSAALLDMMEGRDAPP
jgi:plasmid stability protein